MQLASMKGSLEDQFLDHSPQKLERPNPSKGQGRSLTESSTGWKIRLEATIIKDLTGRESAGRESAVENQQQIWRQNQQPPEIPTFSLGNHATNQSLIRLQNSRAGSMAAPP